MKTKFQIPLLALVCLLAMPATAQVSYAISGSTAYVTSSPNASGNIVIVSNYNGYPVTRIGPGAFYDCANLTSVAMPNSVTNIGVNAFVRCSALTNVTIPNSVTSIGGSAFEDCTSLRTVTIPSGLTSIGGFAFKNCSALDSVAIPNTVISIGTGAFVDCIALTSVAIPSSAINIGMQPFSDCTSLTNVSVDVANPAYSSLDGVLFNKAQTILIQHPAGRAGSYVVPNTVTNIQWYAFSSCFGLTNVSLPNSVTIIGVSAFYLCTNLAGVTIPPAVTSIGSSAFGRCTSLTRVTIPASVTAIGLSVFSRCSSLTNISVEAANPVYSSLNGVLFYGAQEILMEYPPGRSGSYIIPNTVSTIWDFAFLVCARLTSVTIPNSVTSIRFAAFEQCISLTNVITDNGLKSIGDDAFAICSSLNTMTIPNSVTNIGRSAFSSCTKLRSVTIPSSVISIGERAFTSCPSLTNITVAGANPAFSSMDGVLFNKAQTTLIQFPSGRAGSYVFPDSVNNIGYAAFFGCAALTSITVGNGFTALGLAPFLNCPSLTNITAKAANPTYSSLGGVFFDKAQTTLLLFPPGRAGSYAVPNSVTNIAGYAFYSCLKLSSVTVSTNVASIGAVAFYSCPNLTNVTFSGDAPGMEGQVFYNVNPGATVYYYYGTTGWEPTYGGLPTMMLGAPAPQIGGGSAGVQSGGFGFTLNGVVNQTIVIEASTNLTNWQPIWTSTLSALSTNFIDPDWVNHPHRFYRARSY